MDITIEKDLDNATITHSVTVPVDQQQAWSLWADPKKLAKWWGPPSFPVTFDTFDLRPGGEVKYHMTGPDGTEYHGYWDVTKVDSPRQLDFTDGFAQNDGTRITDLPESRAEVTFTPSTDGKSTTVSTTSTYASPDDLRQSLEMGAEEGMREALGQIEGLIRS